MNRRYSDGVLLGGEVAAAAPRLVADAPVAHAVGLAVAARRPAGRRGSWSPRGSCSTRPTRRSRAPGGSAGWRRGRAARRPGGRSARTRCVPNWFGSYRCRDDPEVADARVVGPEVRAAGAALARAHAVAPVVAVGEAAAGPAHDGGLDAAQRIHQRAAHAVDVRHPRRLAHPDAVVHHAAEVLDEVAVDLGSDGADGLIEQDVDAGVGGGARGPGRGAARSARERGSGEGGAARERGADEGAASDGAHRLSSLGRHEPLEGVGGQIGQRRD